VIRFHLTPEDLARTRFAAAPAPLLEISTALLALRRRALARQVPWGAQIRADLPATAAPLLDLIPARGLSPMFIDPPVTDLEEGLHLVRSAAPEAIRAELDNYLPDGAPWLRGLPGGDTVAWRNLESALTSFADRCLGPRWNDMAEVFRRDVARRSAILASRGLAGVFNSLGPAVRWQDGILFMDWPRDLDIHLDGRGLELMPTTLWPGRPLRTHHPDGRHLLLYAAAPDVQSNGSGLPGILGATRTAVLRELTRPCSTRELARRLGISESSASRHAALLRSGGFAATTREGKSVRHSLTPLGLAILARREPTP
jgi:DNA-binding transcriptional ArsR family regulator